MTSDEVSGPGLTIEETAARTGITRHTLRYYERIGLLPPVGRTVSGHRRYSDSDVGWIVFLCLLRETGMSIQDMQRFVDLTREGDHTVPTRVDLLRTHRLELVDTLARLQGHLQALETKIGIYTAMLEARRPEKELENA